MTIDITKLKNIYTDQMDTMLASFGKNCRLIFPPKITNINSGFNDPTRNRDTMRPSYSADTDGDKPTVTQKTITIVALVEWNPRNMMFDPDLKISEGDNVIKLKTNLHYADDINRCDHMVPNLESEQYHNSKFKLIKSVNPRGLVNDRYIVSYWKQVNN